MCSRSYGVAITLVHLTREGHTATVAPALTSERITTSSSSSRTSAREMESGRCSACLAAHPLAHSPCAVEQDHQLVRGLTRHRRRPAPPHARQRPACCSLRCKHEFTGGFASSCASYLIGEEGGGRKRKRRRRQAPLWDERNTMTANSHQPS